MSRDDGRPARVVKDWQPTYPDPLQASAGELLQLGPIDTEWPQWRWGTDLRGKSGWVPISYVDSVDDQTGILRCDYTARELEVTAGEEVRLLKEVGGWYWVARGAGEYGWIPASHVDLSHPGN